MCVLVMREQWRLRVAKKSEWCVGHPVSAAWGVGGENLGVGKNKIVIKTYIQILL